MAEPRRIGNRRLFKLSNHRLSKQSYLQTVQQLEEAVIAQNIALFGRGPSNAPMGGTLSYWSFDVSTAPIINFLSDGELGYNDADGVPKVVRYNPTNPTQVTTLNLAGLVGSQGWIWWRRQESEADSRSEAQWVTPTGEVFTPTNTVMYERVEFDWTTTAADPSINIANGWRLLYFVDSWAGSIPSGYFIPFIDSAKALTRGFLLYAQLQDPPGIAHPAGVNDGLFYLVKRLVDQMWMLQSSQVNIPADGSSETRGTYAGQWYRKPTYGHAEIDTALDYMYQNSGQGVLALITLTYDTGLGTWSIKAPADDYIAPGLLAGGTGITTSTGTLGHKVATVTLNLNAGFTVNGFAFQANPAVLPATDLPLGNRLGPVQQACWPALPHKYTAADSAIFHGVGSGFTDTNVGPIGPVTPPDPISMYARYDDMTLVVYGHKD
jgi:hypothetical protein